MAGGSVQDTLADVALRLESLKASLNSKEAGAGQGAHQLAAIKRMAAELEALLESGREDDDSAAAAAQDTAATSTQHQQPHAGPAPAEPAVVAAAAMGQTGLPATPLDKPKPAPGPSTAVKAAPTPGAGPVATTPLAAEVLASLNHLADSAAAAGSSNMKTAAAAGDEVVAAVGGDAAAEGEAAATLRSLEQLSAGAASSQQQQQGDDEVAFGAAAACAGSAAPAAAALAEILREAQLLPPPQPAHAAATAAAAAAAVAAAGLAAPVLRRQSGGASLALTGLVGQAREARPCNCKRSMCLKMYCECFAAGGFCAPSCSCLNCSNTPADMEAVQAAREVVLAKNPRAFEVKVTAANGHKRGCRCKRSKCLKKYCECFHAGARCNPDVCQCEDCRNTEGDALLGASLAGIMRQPAWADTSADVLAMFQQPLLPPPMPLGAAAAAGTGGSDSSGSGSDGGAYSMRAGGRRRSRVQQLPPPLPLSLPPLPSAVPFSFALPPLPDVASFPEAMPPAAAVPGSLLPPGALPAALAPPAAAALAAFDQQAAAAAFVLDPLAAAAAAAATFAAAATLAEQQQQHHEESMAEAPAASGPASCTPLDAPPAAAVAGTSGRHPATLCPAAAAAAPAVTPKVASALTSHLSDVAGPADSDMHDTATSPAPLTALSKLAARRTMGGPLPATLTLTGGGSGAAAGVLGWPPLPSSRVHLLAASSGSQVRPGFGDENGGDSHNMAAPSQRNKRPRRAASGGVLGAVAAEASEWGLEMLSPPLKRANSMPAVACAVPSGGGKPRGKVSDRVALLKKALAADSAAAAAAAQGSGGSSGAVGTVPPLLAALEIDDGCGAPTAEDEDAISALFELSSSVC